MKELGVRKGYEHLDAGLVDKAFEDGDPEALDAAKKHTHPAVSGRYLAYALEIGKQLLRRNPRVVFGATAVFTGITLVTATGIKARQAHEASVKRAWEDFAAVFKDPLSVEFKKTLKFGVTAVKEGPAEQFIANLCDSSIKRPKEAINFWTGLNPYHPIFLELLDPDTRLPNHPNPIVQEKYQEMIKKMTAALGFDPEISRRVIREGREILIPKAEVRRDDKVLVRPGNQIKNAIDGKLDRWRKAAGAE